MLGRTRCKAVLADTLRAADLHNRGGLRALCDAGAGSGHQDVDLGLWRGVTADHGGAATGRPVWDHARAASLLIEM